MINPKPIQIKNTLPEREFIPPTLKKYKNKVMNIPTPMIFRTLSFGVSDSGKGSFNFFKNRFNDSFVFIHKNSKYYFFKKTY